jgi:hypothetical protein
MLFQRENEIFDHNFEAELSDTLSDTESIDGDMPDLIAIESTVPHSAKSVLDRIPGHGYVL